MCNDLTSYADRQDALTVARTRVIREARKIRDWHCKSVWSGLCACAFCTAVRELERLEAISGWQSAPEKEPNNA